MKFLRLLAPACFLACAAIPAHAVVHTVSIADFSFTPANDTIMIHETVRWTNHGFALHTSSSQPTSTEVWDSGNIGHNGFFQNTFDNPGTFAYQCNNHPGSMHGTIVVLAPTPAKPNTWSKLKRTYRAKPARVRASSHRGACISAPSHQNPAPVTRI